MAYNDLRDWIKTLEKSGELKRVREEVKGDMLSYDSGACCDYNAFHFTGQWHDWSTDLEYFGARFYDSNLGRFMMPDPDSASMHPINPQSLNRYVYALNNPVTFMDPSGLDCIYTTAIPQILQVTDVTDPSTGLQSEVAVKSGDCFSDNDNGVFVNGTVDVSSLTFNSRTGDLGYSFTDEDTGTAGSGVVGKVNPALTINVSIDVWNWAALQMTPVHGLWTYGNWAGTGGMGAPINNADAAAMIHDYCYHQGGFTAGSNFQGPNAQLQACNQSLCDAERKIKQAIITQGVQNAPVPFSSRGGSPYLTSEQEKELEAAEDMINYFTWLVPPGNACHVH